MKWKPYQIKVRSLGPEAARAFLSGQPVDRVSILDVRQPVEYEAGHISGARLIPLPELMDRMGEVPREAFEHRLAPGVMEGGMTTREYIDYYMPDWDDPGDVVSLAMSIEAQALDMYLRASARVETPPGRAALEKIAREEQTHLAHLGRLMDRLSQ